MYIHTHFSQDTARMEESVSECVDVSWCVGLCRCVNMLSLIEGEGM